MKRISAIAVTIILLVSMTACQGGKSKKSSEPAVESTSLYEKSIEMSENMMKVAKDEKYVALCSGSADLKKKIEEIAKNDFSKPKAVYELSGVKESTLSMMTMGSDETLSDETVELVKDRFAASICNQINARSGMEAVASSSMIAVREAFYNKDLKDSVIYLCVYDDGYGSMIAFTPYDGGIVDAYASVILFDGLSDTKSADDVTKLFSAFPGLMKASVKKVEK